MKKVLLIAIVSVYALQGYCQQIGNGLMPVIYNFNSAMLSGAYTGCTVNGLTGAVPDGDHPWQHLFTIRHPNSSNNHQLQLGSSYAQNDRLFFRKIAVADVNDGNSNWLELATRGSNTFTGDQTVTGVIKTNSMLINDGYNAAQIRLNSSGRYYGKIGNPSAQVWSLGYGGDQSDITPVLNWTATGNVGIGTTDPGEATLKVYRSELPLFELQSSVSRLQIGVATCNDCFAKGAKIGNSVFRTLGTSNSLVFNMPNDNNDGSTYIAFGDNANDLWVKFFNNRIARIDGKLIAKEIEVKTNVWADFVFNKDYKLMPLNQLEKYISTHKHLPNIPTEAEVKDKGINVAEMNALLLQKVEELTRYVIDLKKEIEQLKNK